MELSPKQIQHKSTDKLHIARDWLESIDANYPLISCDFETSSFYTVTELDQFKIKIKLMKESPEIFRFAIPRLKEALRSNGLAHPSRSTLTHISIGLSDDEAIVIILSTDTIRQFVLNWLVQTDVTQIWHNA